MMQVDELLAFFPLFDKFLTILHQSGPIIACPEQFVSKFSPTNVSSCSLVDLYEDRGDFVFPLTSQHEVGFFQLIKLPRYHGILCCAFLDLLCFHLIQWEFFKQQIVYYMCHPTSGLSDFKSFGFIYLNTRAESFLNYNPVMAFHYVLASLERRFALQFCSLGTYVISKSLKRLENSRIFFIYLINQCSFV